MTTRSNACMEAATLVSCEPSVKDASRSLTSAFLSLSGVRGDSSSTLRQSRLQSRPPTGVIRLPKRRPWPTCRSRATTRTFPRRADSSSSSSARSAATATCPRSRRTGSGRRGGRDGRRGVAARRDSSAGPRRPPTTLQSMAAGPQHDSALDAAVKEISPLFKQCTRCGSGCASRSAGTRRRGSASTARPISTRRLPRRRRRRRASR